METISSDQEKKQLFEEAMLKVERECKNEIKKLRHRQKLARENILQLRKETEENEIITQVRQNTESIKNLRRRMDEKFEIVLLKMKENVDFIFSKMIENNQELNEKLEFICANWERCPK